MIRNILEATLGPMTDTDFKQVLDLVTSDILVNRVSFSHQTTLSVVLAISLSCYSLVQRIKKAAS